MVIPMHPIASIRSAMTRAASRLYAFLYAAHKQTERERILKRHNIHPSVYWNDQTWFLGDGTVHIGENTYIGKDCFLSAHPATTSITIGKGCAIAHNVHLRTTTFPRIPDFEEARKLPPESKSIVIGDFVWIGNHVYIGPGITVGSNSIIGANSVVTKDVPPNTVVGGTPARVIGTKEDYAKDMVASEREAETITTEKNSSAG